MANDKLQSINPEYISPTGRLIQSQPEMQSVPAPRDVSRPNKGNRKGIGHLRMNTPRKYEHLSPRDKEIRHLLKIALYKKLYSFQMGSR